MKKVFVDVVKDKVFVKDNGRVTEAQFSKRPLAADNPLPPDQLEAALAQNAKLEAQNAFLVSKVSTLTIQDWQAYEQIGE